MTLFDSFNTIYSKGKLPEKVERWEVLVLTRWLCLDKLNFSVIKKVMPYIFYIDPTHYFYLLYANVRKQFKAPYLPKVDKKLEIKEDKLLNKIKVIFGWSNKEFLMNLDMLKSTVLPNRKYWEDKLGIE